MEVHLRIAQEPDHSGGLVVDGVERNITVWTVIVPVGSPTSWYPSLCTTWARIVWEAAEQALWGTTEEPLGQN